MTIIAFCGYTRTGKDTLANYLVEEHGFTKKAYSDKLRDFLYASNLTVVSNSGRTHESLCTLVDTLGWEGVKSSMYSDSTRRLFQSVGNEGVRNVFGETLWSDLLLADKPAKLVIPDLRATSDYEILKKNNAIVIQVVRPGYGAINGHASEYEHTTWGVENVLNSKRIDDPNLYRELESFFM